MRRNNCSTSLPFPVQRFVIFPFPRAIALWRGGRNHLQHQSQLLGFVAFIGSIHNHMSPFPPTVFRGFQQFSSLRRITGLAGRKREVHGCFCVGCNHMNFCCPSCSRLTNRLWTVFFRAPVPSGWTLTAVLSSET